MKITTIGEVREASTQRSTPLANWRTGSRMLMAMVARSRKSSSASANMALSGGSTTGRMTLSHLASDTISPGQRLYLMCAASAGSNTKLSWLKSEHKGSSSFWKDTQTHRHRQKDRRISTITRILFQQYSFNNIVWWYCPPPPPLPLNYAINFNFPLLVLNRHDVAGTILQTHLPLIK